MFAFLMGAPRIALAAAGVGIILLGILTVGQVQSCKRKSALEKVTDWSKENVPKGATAVKEKAEKAVKSAANTTADYLAEQNPTPTGSRMLDRKIDGFVERHRSEEQAVVIPTPRPEELRPDEVLFWDPKTRNYLALKVDGSKWRTVSSLPEEKPSWWKRIPTGKILIGIAVLAAAGLVIFFFIRRRP